ncbi:MAG: M28 family peptidase [Phycisphaerales bacterium]|nr:MAG: M28 family peptidase [Phycisphaerales bacterium]
MNGMQRARNILWFSPAILALAPGFSATASPEGEFAAALVSEQNYRHYLDDMLYTHDGDDRGFGPEHDLAQANIVSVLTSFGVTVELEPFLFDADYDGTDETYYNVVGTMTGTTYPGQGYVIGAHYDSVDNPGADDNASGVALVLEAARVLSAYESDYTIRFVAFDREEDGLIGS